MSGASPQADPARSPSEIVSAAERLAAEIRRAAEADAAVIRERADGDSAAARTALRGRMQRLAGIADELDARLGELRRELDALRTSLGDEERPAAPEPEPAPPAPGASHGTVRDPDEVAARLVALNMAMSQATREETARYLREHHAALADPDALLDEVYASIRG